MKRGPLFGPAWASVGLGVVLLAPPRLKPWLLRRFCNARIARSARIGWLSAVYGREVALGEHSRVAACSIVRCMAGVTLGAHAEVSSMTLVYGNGRFVLGRHGYVGPQSLVNVEEDVCIGEMAALGPRSMVFTHGNYLPATEGYPVRLGAVTIGRRAWLAAGVFVHPGVRIGDEVLVNSRAVITQDIPDGAVVESPPARVVATMARLRRRMTPERVDAVVTRMLERFVADELRGGLGVAVDSDKTPIRFRWRGRDYTIGRLAPGHPLNAPQPSQRCIALRTRADAPAAPERAVLVDLVAGRTETPRDPVHRLLVDFMRRYYGIHLDYGTVGTDPPPARGA